MQYAIFITWKVEQSCGIGQTVLVARTTDAWYGMIYKEDVMAVRKNFKENIRTYIRWEGGSKYNYSCIGKREYKNE